MVEVALQGVLEVPLFWFTAGAMSALAALILMLPWLRTLPRGGGLPLLPWQARVGAVVLLGALLGLYRWIGTPPPAVPVAATRTAIAEALAAMPPATAGSVPESPVDSPAGARAGSMSSAIASLQERLAQGGGTPGDWELLAKSYEFIGRPDAAAQARARRLPPLPSNGGTAAPNGSAVTGGVAAKTPINGIMVSGEVSLAPALRAKVTPGATLFIVAKSVDTPGVPVAVLRTTATAWPVQFTLDDSQSMLPGRNLSTAGRITVEAHISQKGQPLPAAGDLRGTSPVIDPGQHQALEIVIDQLVT